MEIIAFILVLAAIFAVKSVAILRYQNEEIGKSVSFSWTKPGMQEEATVAPANVVAVEPRVVREHAAWTPSYAATRIRVA